MLQSFQLLAGAGLKLKLEVLTASTGNKGTHSRIGSGRVRHPDVEAVQTGPFTLKKVGTTENVSDLTTKYHDEERLEASTRMEEGLRYRGLQHAASAAGESQTAAVNAVLRTQASELDENTLRPGRWISSLRMVSGQSSLKDVWPG